MNNCMFKGRVVRPEWKEMKSGSGLYALKFSLAVEREFKGKVDKMYMQCIAWGKTGEAAKNISDGQEVFAQGFLKQDSWVDKETLKKRYAHSMVVQELIFDKSLSQSITKQDSSPFEDNPMELEELPF